MWEDGCLYEPNYFKVSCYDVRVYWRKRSKILEYDEDIVVFESANDIEQPF